MSVLGNILGGVAGGLASLGSAHIASQNNAETNRTNLQIARETNDANLQLAKQQNDWNVSLWNMQNDYNSYSSQIERWKEAGLNPNLFTGDSSNASSVVSADMANQQQPTTGQQPYDPSQAINSAVGNVMQYQIGRAQADAQLQSAKAQAEQAKTAQYEAITHRSLLPFQTGALASQRTLNLANADLASKNADSIHTMLPWQVDALQAQNLFHRESAAQARSSAHFMDNQAQNEFRRGNWIDREMSARIRNLNAQSFQYLEQGNLSHAQIGVAVEEARKIWSDKNLTNWKSKSEALKYRLANQGIFLDGNLSSSLIGFAHRYSWIPNDISNGVFGDGGTVSYSNPYR